MSDQGQDFAAAGPSCSTGEVCDDTTQDAEDSAGVRTRSARQAAQQRKVSIVLHSRYFFLFPFSFIYYMI